jgi:hypothetical protein
MYEASPKLVRPQNSLQPLWRYLSARRLHDLLSSDELFFAHLPALEDGYEGALTRRSREHLADWFQHQNRCSRLLAYAQVDIYQKHRENFYVNCWHMNEYESYLMWKAYAGRGFAIQTTFERLQASLDASQAVVSGGVVDYVDFARDLTPVGNVFNHVATKDMPYKDEREFRLVFWDIDQRNINQPKVQNGVRIPVQVNMLVRAVVRSPYHEPIDSEIERLLDHHGLTITTSVVSAKGSK